MSQISNSDGMRWNLRRSEKYNQEVVKEDIFTLIFTYVKCPSICSNMSLRETGQIIFFLLYR